MVLFLLDPVRKEHEVGTNTERISWIHIAAAVEAVSQFLQEVQKSNVIIWTYLNSMPRGIEQDAFAQHQTCQQRILNLRGVVVLVVWCPGRPVANLIVMPSYAISSWSQIIYTRPTLAWQMLNDQPMAVFDSWKSAEIVDDLTFPFFSSQDLLLQISSSLERLYKFPLSRARPRAPDMAIWDLRRIWWARVVNESHLAAKSLHLWA